MRYAALFLLTSIYITPAPHLFASMTQIPNQSDRNWEPQINDRGNVVWAGENLSGDREIFLFDGHQTIQLTDNSFADYIPQINDRNQITWMSEDQGIYFYDHGSSEKISDDGRFPQINNHGEVVWEADGVYVYDTKHDFLKKVGDVPPAYWSPAKINEKGQVVWGDEAGNIHYYDGHETTTLGAGYEPDLNDKGKVVWIGADVNTVMYYDGTTVAQFGSTPEHNFSDGRPLINNKGQILYQNGRFLLSGQTFSSLSFFDNGHTTVIPTTLADVGITADLNDKGQFVWTTGRAESSRGEIFLYDNGVVTQLTNNTVTDYDPKINNKGEMVWVDDFTRGKIELARADNPVPEPATFYLIGTGLAGLIIARRRKAKRNL